MNKYWDKAWSLVDGCTPCSPGCEHCWSASLAHRFQIEGEEGHRNGVITDKQGQFDGTVIARRDRLEIPLKRKIPTVWAVWNDLFHEEVNTDFIGAAFDIMAACPQHTFLVLTKRAHLVEDKLLRWPSLVPAARLRRVNGKRSNVWVGVTVCNQEEAEEKMPLLLKAWPGNKWLSIEPMLGPIDLSVVFGLYEYDEGKWHTKVGSRWEDSPDFVVVGCETGPHRRPCKLEWIQSIVDQCKAAGVPCFVKQIEINGQVSHELAEWPSILRVRELAW